jgi:hypothetical protein
VREASITLRGDVLIVQAHLDGLEQWHAVSLVEAAQRRVPITPNEIADNFVPGLRDLVKAVFREVHRIRWSAGPRRT